MHIGLVVRQVATDWQGVLDEARFAEGLGADSVWVVDHLIGFPPERGILEAWTVMSALAASTSTVQIGAQVLCQSFRNPAMLAKMATTLDDVSGGRLRMMIGAGWMQAEYDQYGYPFPAPGVRLGEVRDTVRILKGMFAGPGPFSYDGPHYTVTDAVNIPAPTRTIPVEVGGGGDRLLRLVAREADGWNCPALLLPSLDDRLGALSKACADAGRSPDDLRLSCQIVCTVGDAEAAAHPGLAFFAPEAGLTGSVDEAVQRAGELIERGIADFNVIVPPGARGRACFERLLADVKPQLV